MPSLEEVGYSVKRADSVIDQRSVLSDIVLGIEGADLIVADLTGLNPNVFYELGIAHGLGIPTVLITQSIDELPFDLRSYRASEYSTRFDEAQKLKDFLREVGGEAAKGGVKFASPVADFLPDGPAALRLQASMDGGTARGLSREVAPASVGENPEDPDDDEEGEPGTLDLLHSYIESVGRSTSTLEHISEETGAMGSQIEAHTGRMQEAVASSKPGSVAKVHRIATDVAKDLTAYGNVLQQELPALEQASEEMIDSGIAWLTRTGKDQDQKEVEDFRLQLAVMYVAIAEAMASMRAYRNSFAEAKGATTQLDKASDRVVGLLGRLLTVMEKTQSFASRGCDIAQELADASELHLVAEPLVECFVDANGNEPQPFNAVLIATFNRGVVEQALPYTGEALAKHEPVSWALNEQHVFPESWYRHPYTGLIELAWSDSPEFAGQEIGEKSAVDQGGAE